MRAFPAICPTCRIPMRFKRDEATKILSAVCYCGYKYRIHEPTKAEKKNNTDASPARKASRDELLKLIQHCWLHSGYKNCGYKQMTTRQKKLFNSILCTDIEKGV